MITFYLPHYTQLILIVISFYLFGRNHHTKKWPFFIFRDACFLHISVREAYSLNVAFWLLSCLQFFRATVNSKLSPFIMLFIINHF